MRSDAAAARACNSSGNHRLAQMIERDLVAEKEGLVGRHRLDGIHGQRVGPALYFLHQLADPHQAGLARQRDQPALHQILLVGGQIEAGTLSQQLAQILVFRRRHDRTPANNWINFGAI